MITTSEFLYKPDDHEAERASNSYLMSLIAVIAGLPIPIINLIATGIFYLGNRKGTYFVRWHCTQALLSQFTLLIMNTAGFWWTMAVIFEDAIATNYYVAYILTIILFNVMEFIVTIYTAITTRKRIHVKWFFYGELTNLICKA